MRRSSYSYFNYEFFNCFARHSGKFPYYNVIRWYIFLLFYSKSFTFSSTLTILNIFKALNKYYFSIWIDILARLRYPWFPYWVLSRTGTITLNKTLIQKFSPTSKSSEVDMKPSTYTKPPIDLFTINNSSSFIFPPLHKVNYLSFGSCFQ